MPSFWLEIHQTGQQASFEHTPITIGRGQGADFVLDHPTVSRQHGQIVYDAQQGWMLVVLSRGGLTAINSSQVSGQVPLQNGAVVNFGQMAFTFRSNEASVSPQQGFGGGQSQQGFGGGGGFGGQQQAQQQPQQGFGGQQQSPQQSSGSFGAQSSGAASAPSAGQVSGGGAEQDDAGASGSFGMHTDFTADSFGGDEEDNKPSNVWEEIAQSPEALGEDSSVEDEDDYYARMEEAQRRGDEKAGGTNPLLIVATIAAVGFLAYSFLAAPSVEETNTMEQQTTSGGNASPVILEDVNCMDKADCIEKAKERYAVGRELLEKRDAYVTNLFDGYKKMLEVKAFLDEAGVSKPPEGIVGVDRAIKQARKELDSIYRQERMRYNRFAKRDMHQEMLEAVNNVESYFPDESTPEAKWAEAKKLELKKLGVYDQ